MLQNKDLSRVQLSHRLNKLRRSEIGKSLTVAFFARAVAALGSFAFLLTLGRLYGLEGVGVFALAQSIAIGVAILSRLGMDNSLIKFVGIDQFSDVSVKYLRYACYVSLGLSAFLSCLVFLYRESISLLFNIPGVYDVLIGVCIGVPAFTLSFIMSGYFKGIRKTASAALSDNGMISIWCCIVLLLIVNIYDSSELWHIGFAFAVSAWLVLIQNCIVVIKHQRNIVIRNNANLNIKSFVFSSRAYFYHSLAGFVQTVGFIFVLGFYLNENELGLFRAVQQIGVLISFVLVVINVVYPPRFSAAFFSGKMIELDMLAKQAAKLGFLFSLPAVFICLLIPELVLGVLGKEFAGAALYLQIVAVAQLINVSTGPVGFLLAMSGSEVTVKNISIFSGLVGIALAFVAPVYYGIMGAIISYVIMLTLQNLLMFYASWKILRILPMPISIFETNKK